MYRAAALLLILFALQTFVVSAQTPSVVSAEGDKPQRPSEFGSPTEEMLRRAEIRREEETHKDMVERAEEAVQLGGDLLASCKKHNSLTREDLKRLERIEKLARKIRGGVGGSDDEAELSDPPVQIEPAVARLAKLTGELKESVSKTSRLVISANVIERSNEVIELIRHIRTIKQP